MRTPRLANVVRGRRRVVLIPVCLFALAVLPAVAPAGDAPKIFVMDRCEPDSFDAAVEPGTCIRNGGVTFEKFERRLNPQDGGHNAWRNSRHDIVLTGDQHLTLVNSGGETHSFTEVVDFGAGIVPLLNAALRERLPRNRSPAIRTSWPRARRSSWTHCHRARTGSSASFIRGCGRWSSSAERDARRRALLLVFKRAGNGLRPFAARRYAVGTMPSTSKRAAFVERDEPRLPVAV